MKSTLILLALSTTAAFSQSVLRPYTPPPQPVIVHTYTVTPSSIPGVGTTVRGSDGSSATIRPSGVPGYGDIITVRPAYTPPAIRPLW